MVRTEETAATTSAADFNASSDISSGNAGDVSFSSEHGSNEQKEDTSSGGLRLGQKSGHSRESSSGRDSGKEKSPDSNGVEGKTRETFQEHP